MEDQPGTSRTALPYLSAQLTLGAEVLDRNAALEREKMQDPSDTTRANLEAEPIDRLPPGALLTPEERPAGSIFSPETLARVAAIKAASHPFAM